MVNLIISMYCVLVFTCGVGACYERPPRSLADHAVIGIVALLGPVVFLGFLLKLAGLHLIDPIIEAIEHRGKPEEN